MQDIISEYAELVKRVELGTTSPTDNARRFELEAQHGLYRARYAYTSQYARANIASVIRDIEKEQADAAATKRAALKRGLTRIEPEFWLTEVENTPTFISFKIVSTVPGFRWSGSVSVTGRVLTDEERGNARAWAEDVLAEAIVDPYADRFQVF